MSNLFLLLFLTSFICLISGIIKPSVFSRFVKGKISRKKVGLIFGVTTIVLFVLVGMTANTSNTPQKNANNIKTEPSTQKLTEDINQKENIQKEQATQALIIPKYQIIYDLSNKRYDGGNNFYVLIDPVDLSSTQFKEGIKGVIKKLVEEKGGKNSFEIHDDRKSLDVSFKQYGDMSLGRPRTEEENKIQAIHFVASFDGQLETDIYKNTLRFFPCASKEQPIVGKYIETIEFNILSK